MKTGTREWKTVTLAFAMVGSGRVQSVRVQTHAILRIVLSLVRRHLRVRVGTAVLQDQNVNAVPMMNARGL